MTQPDFAPPIDAMEPVSEGGRNRKFIIGGGVGALALVAIGGYVLLSGGGSDSASDTFVPVKHHAVTASATPTPSTSASSEAVLPVYHGDVDGRDPFALPAAVAAAASPPAAAAAPAAAPAASASPVATSLPSGLTLPTTAGGTTVTVLPGAAGTTTTTTTTSVAPLADQYVQLLRVHNVNDVWTVDVRTAAGTFLGVKPGTKNVGGTLFYYAGEDETSGKPTYVFELGESKGGNLTPNAKESPKKPHADKSTLFLHNGSVDGGIYSE